MTEEIDGYKDDLERQIATLRDGLDRVGRAKDDKKTNVREPKSRLSVERRFSPFLLTFHPSLQLHSCRMPLVIA